MLKRIGNVIEGLVFIVLSLCFQAIFIVLITMAVFVGLSALAKRDRTIPAYSCAPAGEAPYPPLVAPQKRR